MSATSGAFPKSLCNAVDLIARCRYAEMKGDKEKRNDLIHNFFEKSPTGSLRHMLEQHPDSEMKDILSPSRTEHLKLCHDDDQSLVMLFIAVVNACREQMYTNKQTFFNHDPGKPETLKKADEDAFDEAK
jgi:hypothetical protein